MSDATEEKAAAAVAPSDESQEKQAPTEGGEAEKKRVMKEQEAQLASKYPGLKKPSVSSVAQRRISRGGKGQYFDSGEYNKNRKGGTQGPSAIGGGQAPVAVTPGGSAVGPSHLTARSMQRKPSGASRLGLPD